MAFWAVMVLGAILLASAGCSASRGIATSQTEGFFTRVRPASGNTARLERNAHYYRLMGRPQLALKELEEAYARDPDNLKIADNLAHCYEETGRFDQAQKLYREALSRHPDNDALHNNLCFSYYLSGRFTEAETCFKEALARNPGNQAARNNLGLLYCRIGKPEEAVRVWQEAEGETAAAAKLNLAMAALGKEVPASLARSHRSMPAARPQATGQAHLATPTPSPALTVQDRLAKRVEIAARPAAPPPDKTLRPVAPAPGPPLVEGAAPAADAATAPPAPPRLVASGPAPPRAPNNQEPPLREAVTAERGQPAPAADTPRPAPPEVPKGMVSAPKETVIPTAPVAAGTPQPQPVVREKPLTVNELVDTGIEVRNGNGVRYMAHHTRSRLNLEGFTVKRIGNYRDFGQQTTMVYYRPEAERVAQSLYHTFFSTGQMKQTQRLRKGVDIKVVLGRDLLKRNDLMALLAGSGGII